MARVHCDSVSLFIHDALIYSHALNLFVCISFILYADIAAGCTRCGVDMRAHWRKCTVACSVNRTLFTETVLPLSVAIIGLSSQGQKKGPARRGLGHRTWQG